MAASTRWTCGSTGETTSQNDIIDLDRHDASVAMESKFRLGFRYSAVVEHVCSMVCVHGLWRMHMGTWPYHLEVTGLRTGSQGKDQASGQDRLQPTGWAWRRACDGDRSVTGRNTNRLIERSTGDRDDRAAHAEMQGYELICKDIKGNTRLCKDIQG